MRAQHQGPSQWQKSSVCVDNVGALRGVPSTSCARGNSCRFSHILSLKEIDRVVTERDFRGILKNDPTKLQPFLTAMGSVKFKGE